MVSGLRREQMFENLWIADKAAFDTCSVDTSKQENKLLMQCDTPTQLKYFTVVFQAFSAVAGGLEFQPGTEYYFIGKIHHHHRRRCHHHKYYNFL